LLLLSAVSAAASALDGERGIESDSTQVNAINSPTARTDSASIRAATMFGAPPQSSVPVQKQAAEEGAWANVWKNMKTSFAFPIEDIGKKKSWAEGLSGSVNFWLPIPYLTAATQDAQGIQGTQGPPSANMFAFASLYYFPVGYWFVNVSLFQYIARREARVWEPDFTYSFGYNDWHPYTFSLVYGNYGGNKFAPDAARGEAFTRFEEGTWSLGFKFPAPTFLEKLLVFYPTGGVGHQVNVNLTPRFFDVQAAGFRGWKTSLSLNTRYTIWQYFYVNLALYAYPDKTHQQPWDPDFTYGFGYYDWHSMTVSVQYNNYAGNRFPWNPRTTTTGNFLDGILSVSWNFSF
jgi:hypothetical protein